MWMRLVAVMRAKAAKGRIVFAAGRSPARRATCARCVGTIATSTIGGRTAYTCAAANADADVPALSRLRA
jgi:hypothetical protein